MRNHKIRERDDDSCGERHLYPKRGEGTGQRRHHIDEHQDTDNDDGGDNDCRINHRAPNFSYELFRALHLEPHDRKCVGEGT